MESLLLLTALLFVKHFFADGPLQTSYQVANKGRFLHPAGFAHAGVHVLGTGLCLALWLLAIGRIGDLSGGVAVGLASVLALEFVLHYFIDFAKCQVDARYRYSEMKVQADGVARLVINHTNYFMAFLLDQLAHALTLVLIVYLVFLLM